MPFVLLFVDHTPTALSLRLQTSLGCIGESFLITSAGLGEVIGE